MIVEIDSITGRPQAVPGWNLDIRVPGMRQSEEKAVTVPEGVLRERLNNEILLSQRDQMKGMAEQIAHLTAQLGQKEESEPEKELTEPEKPLAADKKKPDKKK